jgi:hypothetical protein
LKDRKAFWKFMDKLAGQPIRLPTRQRRRKPAVARADRYEVMVNMAEMPDYEVRKPVYAIQGGLQVMLASVAVEDEAFA